MMKCAEMLVPALVKLDLKQLDAGLSLASSLMVLSDNKVVFLAQQKRAEIVELRRDLNKACSQFGESVQADGASEMCFFAFEELIHRVDSLAGAVLEWDEVAFIRKNYGLMKQELIDISDIETQLSNCPGGWLNSSEGVVLGDFKSYDAADSIDVSLPLSLFREPRDLVTKKGRELLRWAMEIKDLRSKLKVALESPPNIKAPWEVLSIVLSKHSRISSGEVNVVCGVEFVAAQRELDYRKNVHRVLEWMARAMDPTIDLEPSSRERMLRSVLWEAEQAKMQPSEYSELQKALFQFDEIVKLDRCLKQALSTSHPKLLNIAVEEYKKSGLGASNEEYKRCLVLQGTVEALREALDSALIDKLEEAMRQAALVGMPETNLSVRARNMYDKLLLIQAQAQTAIVLPARGYAARHIDKLRWAVQQADSKQLKGMSSYPAINIVRMELDRCERELRLLKSLREALDSGGWVRPGLGDREQYAKTQSIDWARLREILTECQAVETKTEEGRWLTKWASVVLDLRRLVKEAGQNPFDSLSIWTKTAEFLAKNAATVTTDLVHYRFVLSEFTFFNSFPEFVAVRDEVQYQTKLHAALSNLRLITELKFRDAKTFQNVELELERALERISFFNVDAKALEHVGYREGQALLDVMRTCRIDLERSTPELNTKLLQKSLRIAEQYQFQTEEVVRGRKALEIAENLAGAIRDMNLVNIQHELANAKKLGVASNSLCLEAMHAISQISSILSEAQRCKSVLDSPIKIRSALTDWSGPNVKQILSASELLRRLETAEFGGLLETKEIRDLKEKVQNLVNEVGQITEDGAKALDRSEIEMMQQVWDRANQIGIAWTGHKQTVEFEIKSSLDQFHFQPAEYVKLQRRLAKDKIVRLLNQREELILKIEDFEIASSEQTKVSMGNSQVFLDNEKFRNENYPKVHTIQNDLRLLLEEYERKYQRRLNWTGQDASEALEKDIKARFGTNLKSTTMKILPRARDKLERTETLLDLEDEEVKEKVPFASPRDALINLREILKVSDEQTFAESTQEDEELDKVAPKQHLQSVFKRIGDLKSPDFAQASQRVASAARDKEPARKPDLDRLRALAVPKTRKPDAPKISDRPWGAGPGVGTPRTPANTRGAPSGMGSKKAPLSAQVTRPTDDSSSYSRAHRKEKDQKEKGSVIHQIFSDAVSDSEHEVAED